MTTSRDVVFLFDVDNTLLDNDRVEKDLRHHLEEEFGPENRDRYFAIFEELRAELGYADYLGALQRYRLQDLCDPRLLMMSCFLVDYPFANRLYPGALDALEHVHPWGQTVILSDGDVIFQPRKVERSGLWEAVEGRVLIYIHKEQMLDDVERHYPAQHYVMIDDKLRILTAMKEAWGDRLTTAWVRQGHYALDPRAIATYPHADLTLERIGDLVDYDLPALLPASKAAMHGRSSNESNQTSARSRTKPLA
jgi:FMN phosphatase YigB (HAD superfamily)